MAKTEQRRTELRLVVNLPGETMIDGTVAKVSGEGAHGSFTLLPNHVDCIIPLVPGLLSYYAQGEEVFLAIDGGLLAKVGGEVSVASREAVRGGTLEELQRVVRERFEQLDERQQRARSAIYKMEADFVRRFVEWQEETHASRQD